MLGLLSLSPRFEVQAKKWRRNAGSKRWSYSDSRFKLNASIRGLRLSPMDSVPESSAKTVVACGKLRLPSRGNSAEIGSKSAG